MEIELTPLEKEVMQLLIEGYSAYDITDWLGADYKQYIKIKNNLMKKLKVKRITQILPAAIKYGLFK